MIWLFGLPDTCGGANSERGHTAMLWKRAGLDVSCVYLTACTCRSAMQMPSDANPWIRKLLEAGIPIVSATPQTLPEIIGKQDWVVVFCSEHLGCVGGSLKALGARVVYSPSMSYPSPWDAKIAAQKPDVVHFQSNFQMERLGPVFSASKQVMIHGAFDKAEFPFRPRQYSPDAPFVVGRIARSDRRKWHPQLWKIIGDAGKHVNMQALVMAWTYDLTVHCKTPPPWAVCLTKDAISPQEFYSQCHAVICPNWTVQENWPRAGLEAMASGVPVLADDAGGWREMIKSWHNGALCDTPYKFSQALMVIAGNETMRQYLISNAHASLDTLANSQEITEAWLGVFSS